MGWGSKLTVPKGSSVGGGFRWKPSCSGAPRKVTSGHQVPVCAAPAGIIPLPLSTVGPGLLWVLSITCFQREISRNAPGDDVGSLISK